MKHHSPKEIVEALTQADDLEKQGRTQHEICAKLDISVMTLHRWRHDETHIIASTMIASLRSENTRLKSIIVDLILERTALEEEFMRLRS